MDVSARLFITDTIDANARENILGLDQKLKRLRAEIEAKLHAKEESHLLHLIQEVDQAINAIIPVVTLAMTPHE